MKLINSKVGMRVTMTTVGRRMWDVPESTRNGVITRVGTKYLHVKRDGRKSTSYSPDFWKRLNKVSFDDLVTALLAVPRKKILRSNRKQI